jgi:YD repeat-containing protein
VLQLLQRFRSSVLVLLASCGALAQQLPSITSISPNPGGIGQSVTISGVHFGSSGNVKFNGVAATTAGWSSTTIIATVPTGITAPVTVVVTVAGHSSGEFSFTLNNGPVNYFYDDLGRLVGVLDVNGNAAEYSYDIVGNIQGIVRFTPSQVSIVNFTPDTGPVGTAITINGTGFSATPSQNSITFNGVSASITSATSNQLQVTVPATASTGPISVTSPNGSATSAGTFTVTSTNGIPTITGFSPPSGVAGTSVTVTGTNFDPTLANDKLRLNASQATVGSVTTTITTTVPANTASGHFSLIAPAGNAVSSQDFYVPFGNYQASNIGFTARIQVGGSETVQLGANQIGLVLFDGTAGQYVDIQMSGSTVVAMHIGAHCAECIKRYPNELYFVLH